MPPSRAIREGAKNPLRHPDNIERSRLPSHRRRSPSTVVSNPPTAVGYPPTPVGYPPTANRLPANCKSVTHQPPPVTRQQGADHNPYGEHTKTRILAGGPAPLHTPEWPAAAGSGTSPPPQRSYSRWPQGPSTGAPGRCPPSSGAGGSKWAAGRGRWRRQRAGGHWRPG